MYKINADSSEVLVRHHEETTPELEEIAQAGRLIEFPVPVFKLPEQYTHLGKYVLFDGHHRREAARRTNSHLPLLVLECADDFRFVEGYDEPFWYEQSPEKFELVVNVTIEEALMYNNIDPETLL